MQRLELVDDRFPALMRGEKISTIRWNEGDIHEGLLTYVASKNPALQAVVYVTRSRKMTLAEAAQCEGTTPAALCRAMQRHYPGISEETEILFVEHLTPQQTADKRKEPVQGC